MHRDSQPSRTSASRTEKAAIQASMSPTPNCSWPGPMLPGAASVAGESQPPADSPRPQRQSQYQEFDSQARPVMLLIEWVLGRTPGTIGAAERQREQTDSPRQASRQPARAARPKPPSSQFGHRGWPAASLATSRPEFGRWSPGRPRGGSVPRGGCVPPAGARLGTNRPSGDFQRRPSGCPWFLVHRSTSGEAGSVVCRGPGIPPRVGTIAGRNLRIRGQDREEPIRELPVAAESRSWDSSGHSAGENACLLVPVEAREIGIGCLCRRAI